MRKPESPLSVNIALASKGVPYYYPTDIHLVFRPGSCKMLKLMYWCYEIIVIDRDNLGHRDNQGRDTDARSHLFKYVDEWFQVDVRQSADWLLRFSPFCFVCAGFKAHKLVVSSACLNKANTQNPGTWPTKTTFLRDQEIFRQEHVLK